MSTGIETRIREASAKNAELLRTLADTDYANPALIEQARFIRGLENEISVSDHRLKQLDTKRKSELADHEKYRDSNVRRFLHRISGKREKFDAKAAKEEREYFEALQEQHEAQTLNDGLRHQLDEALRAKAELEVAKATHNNAQVELDNLYNSIFAGDNPGFPNEDELEQKSDQALQKYHDSRVKKEQKDQIVNLLSKADAQAEIARHQMDEAHYRSRGDIMGRGVFNELQEHEALDSAAAAIRMAQTLTSRAGVEDFPPVRINTGGLMSDIFFDNIFTDLARNEEIKRAEMEVARFKSFIVGRLARAIDAQATAGTALTEAEKELEKARMDLQLERQRVFEQVLTAQK